MPACVYVRVCVCVRVCVVAALPQRYFENCILRFSRGFACFDRVAADFDLMTFQHTHTLTHTHMKTYTHVQRARHYQHQRQSNSKHHSLTHSLTHSFVHPLTQSASHSAPHASLPQPVAHAGSRLLPFSPSHSLHVLLSLMSGILRRG